jgi:type VI secretion system protein ImpB
MSTDVSVTPKERVNITYKASVGNAVEERELPLRLLILGDFKQAEDKTDLDRRTVHEVDKDKLNSVMGKMDLSLNMAVPNRLVGAQTGEELAVQLKIKGMKDLEPDSIVQQVPALKELATIRQALLSLKGPLADKPAVRQQLLESLKTAVPDAKLRDRITGLLDQIKSADSQAKGKKR